MARNNILGEQPFEIPEAANQTTDFVTDVDAIKKIIPAAKGPNTTQEDYLSYSEQSDDLYY